MPNNWTSTLDARQAGEKPGFHDHNATIEQIDKAERAEKTPGTAHAQAKASQVSAGVAETPSGQPEQTARVRATSERKAAGAKKTAK